jgi:DNA-binding GntR family transcriptional regulator
VEQQEKYGEAAGSGPPLSRTVYVTERLKEDLANGTIAAGEPIKQTVLARRYGVSPTPVREALRTLQADGLISYSPHKGASVRELKPEAAQDLYRLRAGAESAAAEMAVQRITKAGLQRLEARFDELTALMADPGSTSPEISLSNKAIPLRTVRAELAPGSAVLGAPLVALYADVNSLYGSCCCPNSA